MTVCTKNPAPDAAEVAALLASVEDLPTIPETLIEILDVIDDPDSGPSDLANAVRRDAPLMSRILKLANSPYYSARGDIGDINRCVTALGYRTVRQVAICVQVATVLVKAVADSEGELDYRELWRHSVITGAIAKVLARLAGHPDPEEVFTAGLLHDIGKFILELHAPAEYAVVVRGRAAGGEPLVQAERERFGCDHQDLGAAFARTWRFPGFLQLSFGRHHDPLAADLTPEETRAVALVALADYLANTVEPPRIDLGFDPAHCDVAGLHRAAGLDVETVNDALPTMKDAIHLAAPFLNIT